MLYDIQVPSLRRLWEILHVPRFIIYPNQNKVWIPVKLLCENICFRKVRYKIKVPSLCVLNIQNSKDVLSLDDEWSSGTLELTYIIRKKVKPTRQFGGNMDLKLHAGYRWI